MGQTMRRAPVYFVIAQVRFNAILALDSYITQIQEELRRLGYPDFQSSPVPVINMGQAVASGGIPGPVSFTQAPRYTFHNMDRTTGFVLDQAALSFQTTEYHDFESFSESLIRGLSIVDNAAKLDFTDRIGYRYLDAIIPNDGRDVSEYVNESFMGLHRKVNGDISHVFTESVFASEGVSVTARTFIHSGQIGFPPDLAGIPLSLNERFASFMGLHAALDTDGSWNSRDPFALDVVKARLVAIHSELRRAFDAIVAPAAVEEWA